MVMGLQGGVWAVNFWMPTYLRTVRHLSASGTGLYVAVQPFGSLIGFLIGAYLADAIGRKDVHDLGHHDDHHGARLSVRSGRRHRSPAPRYPPQPCDPDEIRTHGPVHAGALSHPHPRYPPPLPLHSCPP